MVRLARFEPATHGLEGRCSIQLSYRRIWMVGMTGFEPATSCSQSRRATKLRYIPVSAKRTNHNEYYTHPARRCQESIADNIRPTTTSSGNRPLSSAIAFRKLTAHHFLHELDGTAADASLPSHIRGRPAGEE